jgi:hypothetical protein
LNWKRRSEAWAVLLLAPAVITVFLSVGLAMWTDELITIELEKTERAWAVFLLAPDVITVFLLVGLAMWTDELITNELEKKEQGLGCVPISS